MDANALNNEIKELIKAPAKRKWYSKMGLGLFLMTIPTVLYIFIFHYLPIGGLVIAFKDYSSFKGIFDSPWTSMGGFKHFYTFITSPNFWTIIKNTLTLSLASIFFNSLCFCFIVKWSTSKKIQKSSSDFNVRALFYFRKRSCGHAICLL